MSEEKQHNTGEHELFTTGDEVSLSKALWTYFGMLGVAMFISCPSYPFPQSIILAPYFPFGLGTLFTKTNGDFSYGWLAIGYAFYIVSFAFFITVRTKKAYRIEVWILASVLILNVAGCHNGIWPR